MKPVVVIHIPKTAGTSLRKIIKNNYDARELFFVYDNHPKHHSLKELRNLNKTEIDKLKIIMGHFPFKRSLFLSENSRFLTVLREPVERTVSYYHHVMTYNNGWKGNKASLLDYLDNSGDQQMVNHQTRVLSGMDDPITEKHVEQAIKNMDKYFLHVGISENFSGFVNEAGNLLGWQDKNITYENRSTNRPEVPSFSIYELSRIKEANKHDLALYEYVKSRLK